MDSGFNTTVRFSLRRKGRNLGNFHLLCSIAVMDGPVHNQDAAHTGNLQLEGLHQTDQASDNLSNETLPLELGISSACGEADRFS